MQSILRAREAHYGERTIWWSVKPKQYGMLRNMDVYHQIAGQVYYTELAIRNQLSGVPERNKLIIDYEQFCLQPRRIADAIEEKYTDLGLELDLDIGIADKLEPKNQIRIPVEEIERMEKAYEYFEALCESPQASLPD